MNFKTVFIMFFCAWILVGCGKKSAVQDVIDQIPENKSVIQDDKAPTGAQAIIDQIPSDNKSIKF